MAADGWEAAVDARLVRFARDDVAARLWGADPTLWKPADRHHQALIPGALGWLTVFEDVGDQIDGLREFTDELRADGYRHAVLLGMGGSSLAPEVIGSVLGAAQGFLDLHVLDSTDPAAVADVSSGVDLGRTLFVVASKSGGTTETASFHAFFYDRMRALCADHAGRHFAAVTDEDTSLERAALEQDFRAVFVNPSDIGGRYSALSFFGLVPAALIGVDLDGLLDGARRMAAACAAGVPPNENPALLLGAQMGELALAGRDKLTLVIPGRLAPLGAWIEQLVAESTGKEGTGILPVDLEALGPPEAYGDDRAFIAVGLAGESLGEGRLDALARAGHPVVRHELRDPIEIGGEFLRWELATAVAGAVLDVDPFDQPNVQESKDGTKALLHAYAANGALPDDEASGEGFAFAVDADELPDALSALLEQASAGDYLAIQAFVRPDAGVWEALQRVRLQVRGRRRIATTLGYGPRYLHSTGQFHKGGPPRGLFLQVIGHDPDDVTVPGQAYSFGVLKRAQARADLAALRARGRPGLRVYLGDDAHAGAERLATLVADVCRD